MSELVLLETALRLPAPDIEALIQGRMIAAMPSLFLNSGRQFVLYPANLPISSLSLDQYYHSNFLPTAQAGLAQLNAEKIFVKAWARCELCQMLREPEDLEPLSQLTIWTTEALQQILLERACIFLAYLRVYLLPKPLEMPIYSKGNFVPLPHSIFVSDPLPALNEVSFSKRREKLEKREAPDHPALEELQGIIAQFSPTNPAAQQLDTELKAFLGWSYPSILAQPDPDLDWIETIATVGNSSEGVAFEKLVRKSFIKLGFSNSNLNPKASLDPESSGGAGGLDFYCETPYPVVGECKATKTEMVPDGTPAQLVKLGLKFLQEDYHTCFKIIMAAGELTLHAKNTAMGNEMNVLRPETLQRLLELKAKHPGSINLWELKPCLEQKPFGESADTKVNQHIDRIWETIKLRAYIVKLVKNFLEKTNLTSVDFNQIYGVYVYSNPPQSFINHQFYEILLELSSPLTGYLGREKGSDWQNDRFYFLRDLSVEE